MTSPTSSHSDILNPASDAQDRVDIPVTSCYNLFNSGPVIRDNGLLPPTICNRGISALTSFRTRNGPRERQGRNKSNQLVPQGARRHGEKIA
jgi:hypothetical protein